MGAIQNEKIYGLKIRESADDGSDFGTPDADYRFLFLGEDGDLHLKDAADVVTDVGGGGGTSELLASLSYAPGADGTIHSHNTNTLTDVDATNLAITFTAPASGIVLVRLSAVIEVVTSSLKRWGLRESTTTLAETIITANVNMSDCRMTAVFKLTGLSAGSHTYKWAHRSASGSIIMIGGPTYGAAVMEVWSA